MKICEIFHSIQGESTYAGLPCVFVRTTGCNLRCSYCDTKYAYEGGVEMSVDEISAQIQTYECSLVEITGGEPLMQEIATNQLISLLLEDGYKVLLETNGSMSIENIDYRVVNIIDLKCPDSGMSEHIYWENVGCLSEYDQLKFVLSSRRDYDWMRGVIEDNPLPYGLEILISVAFGKVKPGDVVKWMLGDRLNARFQLQLHKYIWNPETRGV